MKKDLLKYKVLEQDEGLKIDNLLRTRLNLSRRIITGMKKNNYIYLNGSPVFVNIKVKAGDEVSVNIIKEESQNIPGEDIPIHIVFEDKDLLILNKQPGIVVHPTKGHPTGTLSNGIIHHWRKRGEDTIVRLVNRLDRDTSGLIIIAKNQFSHQAMAKQLEGNLIQKIYNAVVHGRPSGDEGTIDLSIGRPAYDSVKRVVMEEGQRAVTHYKVIEGFKDSSFLEIILETGKTHQIRVHLSHTGCPLFGDALYSEYDDGEYIGRQALHAAMLTFNHPRSGERMHVKAELPEDMRILIEKLRNTRKD